MKLVYLRSAEADLRNIYDLIAPDSPAVALRFVEDIRLRCAALVDFPRMGKAYGNGLYSFSFDRRVRIIYRVTGDEVLVLRAHYRGRR